MWFWLSLEQLHCLWPSLSCFCYGMSLSCFCGPGNHWATSGVLTSHWAAFGVLKCHSLSCSSGPGDHFDGLVQERRNPSALAIELCLSCTNHWFKYKVTSYHYKDSYYKNTLRQSHNCLILKTEILIPGKTVLILYWGIVSHTFDAMVWRVSRLQMWPMELFIENSNL